MAFLVPEHLVHLGQEKLIADGYTFIFSHQLKSGGSTSFMANIHLHKSHDIALDYMNTHLKDAYPTPETHVNFMQLASLLLDHKDQFFRFAGRLEKHLITYQAVFSSKSRPTSRFIIHCIDNSSFYLFSSSSTGQAQLPKEFVTTVFAEAIEKVTEILTS